MRANKEKHAQNAPRLETLKPLTWDEWLCAEDFEVIGVSLPPCPLQVPSAWGSSTSPHPPTPCIRVCVNTNKRTWDALMCGVRCRMCTDFRLDVLLAQILRTLNVKLVFPQMFILCFYPTDDRANASHRRLRPKVDLQNIWLVVLSWSLVYLSCDQREQWCLKTMLLAITIPNPGLWKDTMEKTITIPFYLNPEATNEDQAEIQNNCKAHRTFIWLYKLFWFPVSREAGTKDKGPLLTTLKVVFTLFMEGLSI